MGKLVKCDIIGCKDPLVSPESSYQVQIGRGTWNKDREAATIDICADHFKDKIQAIAKFEFKPVKKFSKE